MPDNIPSAAQTAAHADEASTEAALTGQTSTFNDPNVRLTRIYTKSGDQGMTSLVNGRRVAKNHPRIEAYGTVDELNAHLGVAGASLQDLVARFPPLERLAGIVQRVQHELFNLGSLLATDPAHLHPKQPRITDADVLALEAEMDAMNAELPDLNSFVLPGGCRLNAELHVCRTICRRAERLANGLAQNEEVPSEVMRYLNRLSDALFIWSRWVNQAMGVQEVLWNPNHASGAR
ncbi:MAG: cob(I)yrinic acid a,c-diamide adenosyltransferase [Bryobacterales bacterium]|jgi:cob(I)alamin adenosyltransferase|nr:cob(I)yrinic acid a,c-diamide adenosyltransferase [Bryobacterales bacterium]